MKTILRSFAVTAMLFAFLAAGYAASMVPFQPNCNQNGLGCSDNGCAVDGGVCQNFTSGGKCGCSYY